MDNIKIIIADDHKLIVDGLTVLLEKEENIRIIGTAENGKILLEKAHILKPDLVITDIDMPIMAGDEVAKLLRKEIPDIKILVLSMHLGYISYQKMKLAGANGYIHKNTDKEELLFAINMIMKGKEYVSSEIVNKQHVQNVSNSKFEVALTKREIEIIILIAKGHANIEIGNLLFISVRTVDTHRTNIMRKLDVNNVAGLIRFAYNNNLID